MLSRALERALKYKRSRRWGRPDRTLNDQATIEEGNALLYRGLASRVDDPQQQRRILCDHCCDHSGCGPGYHLTVPKVSAHTRKHGTCRRESAF